MKHLKSHKHSNQSHSDIHPSNGWLQKRERQQVPENEPDTPALTRSGLKFNFLDVPVQKDYPQTIQRSSWNPQSRLHPALQKPENVNIQQLQQVRVPNQTGLPDHLKAGVENLSRYSLDDVRVHYNSPKPLQLQAVAYTQGTNIHVAPGQEKHLPHEAWHVVQQMQGRVKPTMQMKGNVQVNNDVGLEREADLMGTKALQMSNKINTQSRKTTSNSLYNHTNIIQRHVIVNGEPAIKIDDKKAFCDGKEFSPTDEQDKWINDRYTRQYKDKQEFEDHINGNPVEVGLIKKLGVWYRLPGLKPNGTFFVLGENHGVFGYRELMKESNQKGEVLGESGANEFMSAEPNTDLEVNQDSKALPNQEYKMETVTAKAYYSLAKLYDNRNSSTSTSSTAKPKTDPEDTWIENYQKSDPRDRGRNKNNVPYYMKNNEEIYSEHNTPATVYNVANTAINVFDKFCDEINNYNENTLTGDAKTRFKDVKDKLVDINTLRNKTPWDQNDKNTMENFLTMMRKLASSELHKYKGNQKDAISELKDRRGQVKQQSNNANGHLENAMALRDYAMYLSIIKAKNKGDFTMAGIGNFHAKNLKQDLEAKPNEIPVILYDEFMKPPYTQDAISEVSQLIPDYDDYLNGVFTQVIFSNH